MKKLFFTLFIFSALHSFSQNPLVKMWDYTFGGDSTDGLNAWLPQPSRDYLQQTKDHGYIVGGYSISKVNGDKTQPTFNSSYDYWIVKTDSLGIKQWDKDFGGSARDELDAMKQTADGGYILGGSSLSDVSGNKTQPRWGDYDFWIVKVDSSGSIQWDKDFGGDMQDAFYSIQQTKDKGYILGGHSLSGISGDKTEPSRGGRDYWILKTDSLGNKQWDKRFGGSSNDELHSVLQTVDGGYILAGNSVSGISGDKTQASWGGTDYWVVKIDSVGNKQWDKRYGGDDEDLCWSIALTNDGEYILGGNSHSGISGDKTMPTHGGSYDYWIIKIDSLGTMQWDRDFWGTSNEDEFGNISQTIDGGYLFCGTSYSPISGDKTESNLAAEQSWIVKTDSNGYMDWDKTLLNGYNETCYALQNNEGCYVFANYNNGGIAGDKSHPCLGSTDYWIIKFCDGNTLPPIIAYTADQNLCPGTCTNFTNLTINAVSYRWNFPGATPDTSTATNPTNICYANSGSYDVQLIATNANGSDTLLLSNYITVYPAPAPQGISQSGDTLFANAGANSYQWYFNTTLISGATNYFYVAPSSGDYNVVCTDANGCEVEAAIFSVVAYAQSAVGNGQFAIYPNPVVGKFTILNLQFPMGASVEITIYNLLGVAVQSEIKNPKSEMSVDVSFLEKGIYFLKVNDGEREQVNKLVVE